MKRFDLTMVLGALVLTAGAIGMFTGDVQNYIGFEDPLNEIVMTVMLIMGAIGCIMNIKK